MVNIIGVRFQQNGKMYYFDAEAFTPGMGEYVIVNTVRGQDLGEVVMGVRPMEEEQLRTPLQKTVRMATEQDIQHARDNRVRESEAFSVCQKKIAEHSLEMKLVSVECLFDNSKILFYFTANGRVDFRALVKDLASVFKTRIELRQIGVRDEARMLGGLGPCGRPICCGSFLSDFQPVSIKMAKEQNLSLNPTKISGVCGRLMCCLKYEQDHYEQTRKKMPRVGREVITPDGNGTVMDLNIVKETVSVKVMKGDEGEIKDYPLDKITRPGSREETPAETAEDRAEIISELDSELIPEDETEFLSENIDETTIKTDVSEPITTENPDTEIKSIPDRRKPRTAKSLRNPQKSRENRSRSKPRNSEEQPANRRLGQVVRRENPARTKAVKTKDSNSTPSDLSSGKPTEKPIQPELSRSVPSTARSKSNNWAAAVEQALKAADGNDKT